MRFTSRRQVPLGGHRWVGVLFLGLALVAGCARSPQTESIAPDRSLGGTGGGEGAVLPGTGATQDAGTERPAPKLDPREPGTGGSAALPRVDASAEAPPDPDPDPQPPVDAAPPPPVDVAPREAAPPDGEPPLPPPPPPPPPGPPDLARGRVAHWRFDETAGKTAADSCGVGNHGNVLGVVDGDWRAARLNHGLLFTPGRRTVITVKPHETLRPPRMMSMSLWVRAQSWAQQPRLVQKGELDQQFGLGVEGARLRFSVRLVGGQIAVVTAAPPPINQWSHVAAIFDGWKAQLFVGGNLVATTDLRGYPASTEEMLTIGGRPPGAPEAEHYAGMLDDVILYSRPLSQEEIRLLASGRTP